ncbi:MULTISPECIES: hypothetical protein [Zobellia]|uniref:hypothetical protein n=1 Tax=Zobellia TaxID=112040 RepID=UPI001C069C65|nr:MULTISPECIES: hypothetical protein [unclassified Zobellia]MBU2975492.1 hypothetical protein [Zobellia sp. B3R18]MDO6817593.1 hypothetical protein [Zobellia sp. 1_MG-2023]
MSTAHRVIKNTGFLYAKMAITMFISLYTTRLVLNALGASDFGIFNLVGGAIAMLGFLHAAMSSATQRFMSFYEGKGDKEKQKYIFNVSSVLHFGIAIGLVFILLVAGYFFFNGILNIPPDRVFAAKVIYGSLILSTAFTVMSVPYEAVLNAHENMLYYSIVGILESLLKLTVALIIVYYVGDKLVLYGILMAVIPFISRTIMQVYCHRKYVECVIAPRKYFEKSLMKEMTSFAGWSFLGTTVSMLAYYGQGLVLNMFFGTVVNAAQGVAMQINGQVSVFSNNMMKALNPVIVKSEGANDRDAMHKTLFVGSKISFFLLAIIAIPIIIETPLILKLWLKSVPEYTVIFCRLILVISLIDQLFITLPTAISATGNITKYQISVSLLLLMPLVASIILFKYDFPPYFIYLTFIVQRLVRTFGVVLYYSKHLIGLSRKEYIEKVVFKSLAVIPSLVSGLILVLLLQEGVTRLLVTGTTTITLLVICIWFFGLTEIEKAKIHSIVNLLRKKNE